MGGGGRERGFSVLSRASGCVTSDICRGVELRRGGTGSRN